MKTKKISFVIPTRNEEMTIESVISSLHVEAGKLGLDVIEVLITDDSHDRTREKAFDKGATVLVGGGKGLGFAMVRGLKQAAKKNPDAIISVDSDGQVDISELKNFILALDSENADLVLGSRFLEKKSVKYDYPLINRIGTIVLSLILRKVTGLQLTDSHGGIRAMRPHLVEELELVGTHTYVQETIIDAWEKGFKVVEIPSKWNSRLHGKSRVVGSITKYIFYTFPVLVLRTGSHLKILFIIGLLITFLAIVDISIVFWQTSFSLQSILDRQSLVLFFLLLSTGLNLFFFGVTLELLTQMKRNKS